jgi:hypothetical protein
MKKIQESNPKYTCIDVNIIIITINKILAAIESIGSIL